MKKALALHLGFVLLTIGLCGCQNQQLYRERQLMMGTIIEVISPDKQAADIAFREIKRIDNLLSIYKDDSEISRLNKQQSIQADRQALFVIKRAGEFWKETQGAFDITVGPLMELWGFYNKMYRLPTDLEIKGKLSLIGFDKIKIDGNIIELKLKGMKVDLGAIAKGYAVDCAIEKLKLAGIKSALLNAGGDIYCLGSKQGLPWRVAIRKGNGRGTVGYLELKDKAVATSGGYEQYFMLDKVRYCHILNPKTGRPADSGITSVTVIAKDCLTADALATSIFILGKQKGEELAKKFNARVIIY